MSRSSGGISGTAVAAVAGGALLIWTGITGEPLLDALRAMAAGQPPRPSSPGTSLSGPGAGVGGPVPISGPGHPEVAAEAVKWLGVPYRWAGNNPTTGWDCSGYVTWVLRRCGLPTPTGRPTSASYLVWSGARTIPEAQVAAGDLLVWGGHVAIALGNNSMAEAPGRGKLTRRAPIRRLGLTVRRIR